MTKDSTNDINSLIHSTYFLGGEMVLLCKSILVVSFSAALISFLFWPTIEPYFVSPVNWVADGNLSDLSVDAQRHTFPTSKVSREQIVPQPLVAQPKSGIYRWKDENGRIVFSDRPNNESAVEHQLIEIGYIHISDNLNRQEEANLAQLKQVQADLVAGENGPNHYRVASQAVSVEYDFSLTSAGQKHGYVLMSGRITSGPACKQLRVFASAKSDMGGSVRAQDDARYNGFGSSLFEMKPSSGWNGSGRRPQWEITIVSASCLSQKI